MKFIFEFIFGKIARSLDGYKLYILGTAAILKGVLGIIAIYWPESGISGLGDLDTCINEIWGGCIAFAGKSAIKKTAPSV